MVFLNALYAALSTGSAKASTATRPNPRHLRAATRRSRSGFRARRATLAGDPIHNRARVSSLRRRRRRARQLRRRRDLFERVRFGAILTAAKLLLNEVSAPPAASAPDPVESAEEGLPIALVDSRSTANPAVDANDVLPFSAPGIQAPRSAAVVKAEPVTVPASASHDPGRDCAPTSLAAQNRSDVPPVASDIKDGCDFFLMLASPTGEMKAYWAVQADLAIEEAAAQYDLDFNLDHVSQNLIGLLDSSSYEVVHRPPAVHYTLPPQDFEFLDTARNVPSRFRPIGSERAAVAQAAV